MLDHLLDAARRGLTCLAGRPDRTRDRSRLVRIDLPRWESEGGSTRPEPVDTPVGRASRRDARRGNRTGVHGGAA